MGEHGGDTKFQDLNMKLLGAVAAIALVHGTDACWWVRPAPRTTTTTTTTTTTRAPTKCELERDALTISNPENKHILECHADDGEYRADQYEIGRDGEGTNYCVDWEGEKYLDDVVRGERIDRNAFCEALRA